MAGAFTITDLLNEFNNWGGFSYVIPFLLIFALIFAILKKSRVLGENNAIMAIVSVSVGLLALQYDQVSVFYSIIFPRFGVGLAIFLVLIIMLGFFYDNDLSKGKVAWIGWVVGIGVAVWSIANYDEWFGDFGGWFSEYIYSIIILGAIIAIIFVSARSDKKKSNEGSRSASRE